MVHEYWNPQHGWSLSRLAIWLPIDTVQLLQLFHLSQVPEDVNQVKWKLTALGHFKTASGKRSMESCVEGSMS